MNSALDLFRATRGPAMLWEDESRTLVAANPRRVLRPDSAASLRTALQPSSGFAAGYLSYGVSRWLERLPDRHPALPIPEAVVMHFQEVETFRAARGARGPGTRDPGPRTSWSANCTRAEFEAAVISAKEAIAAGEAFQIVVSQRWDTDFPTEDALALYATLRELNPSPYMFVLRTGECTLVGASPEMLVRVNDRVVEARPIAGTRPRGGSSQHDEVLEKDLLADPKENAEHLMLVDLGRNDVGRVSERGSVKVTEFRTVERYSHVMHLVSHVKGQLRSDLQPVDALLAAFPAGTVTGAPKIRAMELIDELEFSRRGPYAGAVVVTDGKNLDSCIAIRTAVLRGNVASVQAGAGIVFDSDPSREYEETVNKAAAMKVAIERSRVPESGAISVGNSSTRDVGPGTRDQ